MLTSMTTNTHRNFHSRYEKKKMNTIDCTGENPFDHKNKGKAFRKRFTELNDRNDNVCEVHNSRPMTT